jgi:oligopeptide transport system permease protein
VTSVFEELDSPPISFWQDARRRFFRNRGAVAALGLFVLLLLIAAIGPFVLKGNYQFPVSGKELKRIGDPAGLLGTDDLGRDMLRRVVRGLGISMALGASVALTVTMIGMVLGGAAGYFGGWIDVVVGRFLDTVYAIPYVITAFALLAVLGRTFWAVVVALTAVGWLQTARLFRAAVMQVKDLDYIEAARATGAKQKRILLSHIVPNALPPILASIAFSIAGAILAETIYAFLGIGFTEPRPSIGVMISSARNSFTVFPHLLLVPAFALILLTLSIVLIGDGLRDALDPKLRGVD